METARLLGNNITWLLNQNSISKEEFAKALGYSTFDVQKLCDARLFASQEDILEIAQYFNVSIDDLYNDRGDNEYKGNGFMHCMGQFKDAKNKTKILDILDMYCDIKEVLNK